MKKIFAITLVLVMMLAMSVTVFAADSAKIGVVEGTLTDSNNKASVDITITNNVNNDNTEIYSVDVAWTNNFVLSANTGKWDPEHHVYTTGTTSITGSGTVTVKNHSNVAVRATIAITDNNDAITFTSDAVSLDIGRADDGASLGNPANAPQDAFNITAAVDADEYTAEDVTVTATVTIAKQ